MIEVQNLTKCYGDFVAISNVTFDVKAGEIVGFLGPNAAGKTTTMRVITGYLSPTFGNVKVNGYDVYENSMQVKKIIGYLPEKPPLYPDLQVKSYLKFVAEIKGVPYRDINNSVELAMEKTAITHVANKLIGNLSKGYQQRVGLAQALVHNPKVLILDEPTVGLDPTQIIEVRNLIKSLKDSHTVVLSTHILPEVSMTCSRVIIINKGTIIAEDTPAGLAKRLATDETIELIVSNVTDTSKFKSLLSEIDGVKAVDVLYNDNDKTHKATILVKSSFECAPIIAQKVVNSNLNLHKMNTLEMSLEEAFLRLVSNINNPTTMQ